MNDKTVSPLFADARWYQAGLRFECTRCGKCCGGAPGEVRVNDSEIKALAKRFHVSVTEFKAMFTDTLRDGGLTLREKRNYECIFYDKRKGCLVYEDRPQQCRTWPFWKATVASPKHWDEAAELCPGIGKGPLHSPEAIQSSIAIDGTSGEIPESLKVDKE